MLYNEQASSPAGSLLLGLLNIVVQGVDVDLGLDCSPITVIGAGGGNCNSNVVCCQNNAVVRVFPFFRLPFSCSV